MKELLEDSLGLDATDLQVHCQATAESAIWEAHEPACDLLRA